MDDGGSRPPPALCMYVILLCMYIVLGYLYTKIPASLTNTKALGKDHVRCDRESNKLRQMKQTANTGLFILRVELYAERKLNGP